MKQTDRVIQSKLKDHEVDVPAGLWDEIERRLPSRQRVPVWKKYVRYAAAASLLLACGLSTYLLLRPHTGKTTLVQQTIEQATSATESLTPTVAPVATTKNTESQKPEQPSLAKNAAKEMETVPPASLRKDMAHGDQSMQQPVATPTYTEDGNYTHVYRTAQPEESLLSPGDETRHAASEINDSGHEPGESQARPTPSKETLTHKYSTSVQYADAAISGRQKRDKQNGSGFSLGVVSANAISATQYAQDTRITRSNLYYADENPILKYQHKVPISVGVTVEKQFGKRWGLETGLVYTLLRSDYKTENLQREGKQELHYLGIPLMARFKIFNLRFLGLYVAAGPQMDFNIYGRRTDDTYTQLAYSTYTENIRDHRVQWSAHLKVGVSYIISRHFDLYAEPAIAYFFDNGNKNIENLWKEKPLNFAFHLGFRTKF